MGVLMGMLMGVLRRCGEGEQWEQGMSCQHWRSAQLIATNSQ